MVMRWLVKPSMEHGHSHVEILARIEAASGRRSFLRDAVYGGIDGAVTTFAIIAGVEGAGLDTQIIMVLGIANVLADGFSMAASNYSGIRADNDYVQRIRSLEEHHIRTNPDGERREIRAILKSKGLGGKALDEAVGVLTAHQGLWVDMMLVNEHGVSPIPGAPIRASLVTFSVFIVCGFVPLLPFALGVDNAFDLAIPATALAFLLIGSIKSRWTLLPWWRSALETLVIGTTAAAIAWSAGFFVSGIA